MVIASMESSQPSAKLVSKAEEIHRLLNGSTIDVWKLRELALSEGGLVDDAIRKKAWPILVGIDDAESWCAPTRHHHKSKRTPTRTSTRGRGLSKGVAPLPSAVVHPPALTSKELGGLPPRPPKNSHANDEDDFTLVSATSMASLSSQVTAVTSHTTAPPPPPTCLDEAQVARDVARCTWHLLTGSQRVQRLQMEYKRNRKVARHIHKKQDKLGRLICDTLVASYETPNPLRYYQGYHDVACIILSTLQDMNVASRVLLQISYSHLRDCCNPDFQSLQAALHLTVMPMLRVLDPFLYHKLEYVDMTPYFCLSWILTWFAHDVRDTALVKRLFDAFLASHAMLPTYVAIAMLIRNRQEILDCENDFSQLHQCLCGLPKNSSRVGWKYRPGEGYVTDEEHGGTTVSTTSSMGTADFLLVAAAEDAEHHDMMSGNGAPTTLLSSISSLDEPSISFEHLLQEALDIMMQIPPSRISVLKEHVKQTRWFSPRRAATNRSAQAVPPLPRMLQEPPFWSVRQFSLRSHAGEVSSRHSRKHRSRSRSQGRIRALGTSNGVSDSEKQEVQEYLKQNMESLAVIAAGYGSGRFRGGSSNRILSSTGAAILTIAIVAVALGVVHKGQQQKTAQRSDTAIHESNDYLLTSQDVTSAEILALSNVSDSFDTLPDVVHGQHCNDISVDCIESHGNRTTSTAFAFGTLEVLQESDVEAAVSLLTQLSPNDYYLSGMSDYKALLAAAHKVIQDESLLARRVWLIAASKTTPYIDRFVRNVPPWVASQCLVVKSAFEQSSFGRQLSVACNLASVKLKWGKVSAGRGLVYVISLAEHRISQSVAFCDRLRVGMQPHLQNVVIRATGALYQVEGAAKYHGRSIVAMMGNSKIGVGLQRAIRVVSASPVTLKFIEVSVGLLMDASLNNLYG